MVWNLEAFSSYISIYSTRFSRCPYAAAACPLVISFILVFIS